MEYSKVVLVDMDDVVAGFYQESYNRMLEIDSNIDFYKEYNSYYFEQQYPKYTKEIRDIYHSIGFFASLPLIEGSMEGWQKLKDNGYDPVFCSAPLLTNPYCIEEKKMWIEKHFVPTFGKSVLDRAILTRDKYKERGIALIDDRPIINNSEIASWMHILFETEFNQDSQNELRISGWDDDNLFVLLDYASKKYRDNNTLK